MRDLKLARSRCRDIEWGANGKLIGGLCCCCGKGGRDLKAIGRVGVVWLRVLQDREDKHS